MVCANDGKGQYFGHASFSNSLIHSRSFLFFKAILNAL